MRDIRDLLCGSLHIQRIVFACESTHVHLDPVYREEKRMCYYIGATSDDRFLLIEIPSAETANQPVDLLQLPRPVMVARTSDADFYYNGPLITPRPRSDASSNLQNAFRAQLGPLRECLQLGITVAKPGSFRWDGDHFTAEYTDEMKNRKGVRYPVRFGKPGEVVPESVKEKFLADLQNPPANPLPKTTCTTVHKFVGLDGKVRWSSDGNLEPPPTAKPAPGSVEERIAAHYMARHEARMAKGVNGQCVRDAQGNVSEIRLEFPYRIELDYAPSNDLPLPWPHRIRKFINSSRSERGVPSTEMTVYAASVSDQPLDDATFVPWRHLKEGTYVQGTALPNGHVTIADPKDNKLLHDLTRPRDLRWFKGHKGS
jgi:hypothetical protein